MYFKEWEPVVDLREILKQAPRFRPNGPVGDDAVVDLERWLGQLVPADYREFLLATNGGKGMIGSNPVFFERAGKIQALNDGIAQVVPHFVMIGSDCIGGGYFLDRRTGLGSVVRMELIDLDLGNMMPEGATFTEFLEGLLAS